MQPHTLLHRNCWINLQCMPVSDVAIGCHVTNHTVTFLALSVTAFCLLSYYCFLPAIKSHCFSDCSRHVIHLVRVVTHQLSEVEPFSSKLDSVSNGRSTAPRSEVHTMTLYSRIFHNAMTISVLWCYKPADGMWCVLCVLTDCTVGQFQCDSGQCVVVRSMCDGFTYCVDGSDQANCCEFCHVIMCQMIE